MDFMSQTSYWIVSIVLGCVALAIAAASLFLGLENRSEQRRFLLAAKKTETLTKLAMQGAKLRHLELIYAQQLHAIQTGPLLVPGHEADLVRSNLDFVIEHAAYCDGHYTQLRETLTDIEELEDLIAAANSFIAHVSEKIEKEQKALDDLLKLCINPRR
jgi:hypothetical protein